MSQITIYHNPACGMFEERAGADPRRGGETPTVVEYLKNPPDRAMLEQLVAATGGSARALLRQKAAP